MVRFYALATAAGFAALTSMNALAADPLPTESHKVLPADLAVEAAQAAIAACKAQGYGVSVVIVDRNGLPKVEIVRDGPRGVGPDVAMRKAYTAAMLRVSTGDYTKHVSQPGAFNPGMYDSQLSTGRAVCPSRSATTQSAASPRPAPPAATRTRPAPSPASPRSKTS